jgi:UDP-N-acetyl-2-amino-2-deoxyglucuronate dehydrogenase
LVLNPWNLDALQELEEESEGNIYTILQLRVHPSLIELKNKIEKDKTKKHEVSLTYITSRGPWYKFSWKGIEDKSGGVATNIGVHFFDLLIWLFGSAQTSQLHLSKPDKMSGFLELERANVKWFLSIDRNDLPAETVSKGRSTFRSIQVDNTEVEFTEGFTDLHTRVYEETLSGKGFRINDARPSIQLVYELRNLALTEKPENIHPVLRTLKS